jgi:hypothetical protein
MPAAPIATARNNRPVFSALRRDCSSSRTSALNRGDFANEKKSLAIVRSQNHLFVVRMPEQNWCPAKEYFAVWIPKKSNLLFRLGRFIPWSSIRKAEHQSSMSHCYVSTSRLGIKKKTKQQLSVVFGFCNDPKWRANGWDPAKTFV